MGSPAAGAVSAALGPANPFAGLRPFQETDAAWFFGRGREINDLLKRLRRVRFLAVVGPSGCGKSSLIKAGMLSGIRDGYLDADWKIASFCPGEAPLANLSAAIAFGSSGADAARVALDRGPLGLINSVSAQSLPAGTNVLVFVDQFEELFQFVERRGAEAAEEVKAFLKLLLAAASSDDAPIYIVITMRIEWLNECSTYAGLAEAINEGIYLVPQMSRRQFQQVILGPIEAADGSVTAALVDRMLNDLDARTDQLPVLQHALLRMWELRKPEEPLGIPLYERVGTFSECLSSHADEIFEKSLTDVQRTAAERLFRAITQVVKNRKVRRPRPLEEIAAETGIPWERLAAVVEIFREPGRSFLAARDGTLSPKSIVDITHEALIRQWNRLAKWVDQEAVLASRTARLEDDAARWIADRDEDRTPLYRGRQLHEAEEVKPRLPPASPAVEFLRSSRRAERRRYWTSRSLATVAILLVAAGLAWFGYQKVEGRAAQALSAANSAAQNQLQQERAVADLAQKQSQRAEQNAAAVVQEFKAELPAAKVEAIEAKLQAPIVYIEYDGTSQAALANMVRQQLLQAGYRAPGTEAVGNIVPGKTQVRYFVPTGKPADPTTKEAATRLASVLTPLLAAAVDVQPIEDKKNIVPANQFEIWLSNDAVAREPQAPSPKKKY